MKVESVWLKSVVKSARALRCKISNGSDYKRWTNPENLSASWDPRTEMIARLIPPGRTVVEFGAGRHVLRTFLDETCKYHPFDLSEAQGSAFCDLNLRPLPDIGGLSPDVVVFSGVLEYVADVPAIAKWLAKSVPCCIASYSCVQPRSSASHRTISSAMRLQYGWINAYSEDEFLQIFSSAGFTCSKSLPWKEQTIFVLDRVRTPSNQN